MWNLPPPHRRARTRTLADEAATESEPAYDTVTVCRPGEYVVYWSSALYPTTDTAGRDINTSYQRMMYATTRDFVTFSECGAHGTR